jgi:nucleotide-binding universal stress UspA family protein
VIVASAIIEDTVGWIIIAITFSLAGAGTIDLVTVSKSLIGTAVFLIGSFTVGRPVVFYLIRWANDNFESDFPVITMILVIMGAMALTTHLIGVHTVLGAFVAGVLIGDSPILTKHIDEQLRGLILAFFMPVFFGTAGLSTDLAALRDPQLLLLVLGLIAVASLGKFIGAFVGGEIGGLTRREALAIACGMNARGSTEIIVASIGLSMGALTQNLFTMIVTMAVVTTMAMPPMLRWALSRVPIGKSEKDRLKREEVEAEGFVADLERFLLAVDDGANGRFASRLAGSLAGPRGSPVTVLRLAKDGKSSTEPKRDHSGRPDRDKPATEKAEDTVRSAARSGKAKRPPGDTPPAVSLTVRELEPLTDDAIAKEARKGYNLFVVGVENARSKSGDFHPAIVRITSAFDGPLAIVAARGIHLKEPDHSPLHILVPVNGTDVSRRAAEVAINIARVVEATITALYVSNPKTSRQRGRRDMLARRNERAILNDIVELADQYKQKIRTTVRSGTRPDQAILSEIKRNSRNLIVMGISRRPGEKLFFGDTATAVFEHAPISGVFLST